MTAVIQDVKSVALSGTDVITVTLPSTGNIPQSLSVGLGVKYAAVASTSGVQVSFTISSDGSTFVASKVTDFTVAPAEGVFGYNSKVFTLQGPNKLDTQPIVAVKITCTNLDATNAAVIAVITDTSDII